MAKKARVEVPGPDELGHISEGLHALAVKVDDLQFDPRNARRHNARNLGAIQSSLVEFKQRKNLVVRRDGTVIAGNGTLEIARALGWKWIAAVYVDDDSTMAAAYALADNKTAELSDWDVDVLGDILRDLQENDAYLLDHIGFEEKDIERILRDGLEVGHSVEQEWEASGMPEFKSEDLSGVRQIIVHFRTHEDAYAFSELLGQSITDKTKSLWYPEAERERACDKRVVSEA